MLGLRFIVTLLLAGSALGFSLWLFRRVRKTNHLPLRRMALVLGSAALFGVVSVFIQRWALDFAGLASEGEADGRWGSAIAVVLFFAPLEEALKVVAVWPHYLRRRLSTGQMGATYAVLAAGGFACAETLLWFVLEPSSSWLHVARAGIALPAHFFFAGLWGYMLGGGERDRWFGVTWLASAFFHGVYDHIVFGRGPALLVIVVPVLLFMGFGVWGVLKEPSPQSLRHRSTYSLFEPPSFGTVREVMARKGRRLMIHWILGGALVTLGVMFVSLASAVYLGHRWGIDFSLADEIGVEGAVPIALLGSALLLSFPVSAYLIARASGAVSVLEPAWATGAAIVVILALFSVTEPTALVVALGVAPVGFALACVGAWFGLERG